jgi:hypothetical protein
MTISQPRCGDRTIIITSRATPARRTRSTGCVPSCTSPGRSPRGTSSRARGSPSAAASPCG